MRRVRGTDEVYEPSYWPYREEARYNSQAPERASARTLLVGPPPAASIFRQRPTAKAAVSSRLRVQVLGYGGFKRVRCVSSTACVPSTPRTSQRQHVVLLNSHGPTGAGLTICHATSFAQTSFSIHLGSAISTYLGMLRFSLCWGAIVR